MNPKRFPKEFKEVNQKIDALSQTNSEDDFCKKRQQLELLQYDLETARKKYTKRAIGLVKPFILCILPLSFAAYNCDMIAKQNKSFQSTETGKQYTQLVQLKYLNNNLLESINTYKLSTEEQNQISSIQSRNEISDIITTIIPDIKENIAKQEFALKEIKQTQEYLEFTQNINKYNHRGDYSIEGTIAILLMSLGITLRNGVRKNKINSYLNDKINKIAETEVAK